MNGGSAVSCRSKNKSVVAHNGKDAQFIALSMCVREILWLKKISVVVEHILNKNTVEEIFKIIIGEDNQACISNARNPVLSGLSKHIDPKY